MPAQVVPTRAMLAQEGGPCRSQRLLRPRRRPSLRVPGSQPCCQCCCCCSGAASDQDKGLRAPAAAKSPKLLVTRTRRVPEALGLQLSPLQRHHQPPTPRPPPTPRRFCSNAIDQRPQNHDKHFTLTAVFSLSLSGVSRVVSGVCDACAIGFSAALSCELNVGACPRHRAM